MDFNACDLEFLEKRFGLIPVMDADFMRQWLDASTILSDGERFQASELRNLLNENVLHWNEQELSLHFIGPLFSIIHFTVVAKMNLFAQRFISADVPDRTGAVVTLAGRPDGLLASGYRSPERPYFSFQEYKREKDPTGDPAGQCLAAMLAGQALNGQADQPVYGCYVVGENWRFIVLLGKRYAISPAFSAATDEVYFIAGVLKRLRQVIYERLS